MLIGARWRAPVARSTLLPVKPAYAPDDTAHRPLGLLFRFRRGSKEAERECMRAGEKQNGLMQTLIALDSCACVYNFM
jgi:hypothetical protein